MKVIRKSISPWKGREATVSFYARHKDGEIAMTKCKNCGHTIIYSDEDEFWFHERENVKWTKDVEYDYTLEDEDRFCSLCGCKEAAARRDKR